MYSKLRTKGQLLLLDRAYRTIAPLEVVHCLHHIIEAQRKHINHIYQQWKVAKYNLLIFNQHKQIR